MPSSFQETLGASLSNAETASESGDPASHTPPPTPPTPLGSPDCYAAGASAAGGSAQSPAAAAATAVETLLLMPPPQQVAQVDRFTLEYARKVGTKRLPCVFMLCSLLL